MNSDFDNPSESSLPTQPVHLPSSPPFFKQSGASFTSTVEMDGQFHPKSEPPATQNDDTASPSHKRVSSDDTERPPSAQQVRKDSDQNAEEDYDEMEEDDVDSNPAQKIEDFDWNELHGRYHEAMNKCRTQEGELAEEWESLMNYFRIWAESGHEHETDRTFQRLQTRTKFVQNSEAELESKRNHYIDVVKAFESALHLLKMGFGH
ncbi:hypothetical protein HBI56_211440 [Parastagonospora nodorum]|uniref:Uncharacterized protein n=1 Tax=Phaeosphaeria nodorum (strain SN15 / ATCC MYA-4574 / FGSC 10173) TaxID=321614 RepID=A0A7U2F3V2_PHANO|nr:hypothetical protein HBH56_212930 [Parastagonospora nodorum]QRC97897.1 hypothetical protein JI435_152340 [Parastagonospora nodorum SN15]KAH3923032.1 hypothetical protein HBH54_214600 [Parastagonospora nodorum]KAH3941735.1 hypothetical protein HBH53_197490 [Parastagonospora nodorum]KAH3961085.1 hypothetical protein HBH51_187310 [Parastagonospora nodorum]